jgi:TDG/mug DNA glycosylase family protein
LGVVSSAFSGLNAHWTAATLAEEFAKLRVAAADRA